MIEAVDEASLVERIVAAIDDGDQLERMADSAWESCRDAFSWTERGVVLARAVEAARASAS